ncbi:MAG: GNAT family N-acetyltransferase [Chloroflexi bacterium]|nr:GNAT family N-acetyltransferase [Chloroflexota bacterium]
MSVSQIRLARLDDADGIARVHVDTWRTTYAGIVPEEHLANLSYTQRAERWRSILEQPGNSFIFVAETGAGKIIGFATGMPERENDSVYKSELGAVYVLQAYQGQGIGRQLVEKVVKRLRHDRFNTMLVWVLAENPSRHFYAALGGKPVREKPIVIAGKELVEVAYGWDDLAALDKLLDEKTKRAKLT